MGSPGSIAANAERVRERVAHAAVRSGRDPSSVRVVAVAKKFPATHVQAAAAAGLRDIGENRVQEALQKVDATRDNKPAITWHLVGHLQSNKARRASQVFGWIHSIDSIALLKRLDMAALEAGTRPNVLVQVDLAGEATKYGATAEETGRIFDAATDCAAVRVRGLMVLPPWSDEPEFARPYFQRLRELRDELIRGDADPGMLTELSMGMSHDLEVGVEEGATIVRVGTAIFGPRPSNA